MAKTTASGPPVHKKQVPIGVEADAQEMLTANENGEIDNVFDIVDELASIEERLPATSPLRPQWDAFHAECMQTMIDSAND